jgi:hypothetical protein
MMLLSNATRASHGERRVLDPSTAFYTMCRWSFLDLQGIRMHIIGFHFVPVVTPVSRHGHFGNHLGIWQPMAGPRAAPRGIVAKLLGKSQRIKGFRLHTAQDLPTAPRVVMFRMIAKAGRDGKVVDKAELPDFVKGFAVIVARTTLHGAAAQMVGQVANLTMLPGHQDDLATKVSLLEPFGQVRDQFLGRLGRKGGIHGHARFETEGRHGFNLAVVALALVIPIARAFGKNIGRCGPAFRTWTVAKERCQVDGTFEANVVAVPLQESLFAMAYQENRGLTGALFEWRVAVVVIRGGSPSHQDGRFVRRHGEGVGKCSGRKEGHNEAG